MDLVNKFNDQFIAPRIGSKKGVTCDGQSSNKQSGGGYGATAESLAASANSNIGKGHPSPIKYTQCNKQTGGGHNYDADGGFSYGYTKAGAAVASELKGSYAPISINKKTNMCGGKKRRKRKTRKRRKVNKKKRRRKNKTRKSRKRRKRKTKRRRKYRRKRGGSCSRFRKRTRKIRGGAYSQYMSNIPDTPSHSSPNPSSLPWATGPGSFKRQMNCNDNYNHFKK